LALVSLLKLGSLELVRYRKPFDTVSGSAVGEIDEEGFLPIRLEVLSAGTLAIPTDILDAGSHSGCIGPTTPKSIAPISLRSIRRMALA
jgi:hypothetical protein